MTNQTILSDAELIIKGYNSVIADAQDEYEEIKDEVLLQLEDLGDDGFQTYREFELRLEAYENGAFDPDIEKILGIGGRKAGTWNPISQQAKDNRAEGRGASDKTDVARRQNIRQRDAASAKPGLQPVHASQFKGAQPGGEPKGAGRGYKGGDLSDRDTIAGAAARKILGGRKKAGDVKGAVAGTGKKVGAKVSAGVEETGEKVKKVGAETRRRGKLATNIATTAARGVKDVVGTGQVQPKIRSSGPRSSGPYNRQGPSQQSTPASTDKAPSAPKKWGEAGFTNWASKSFTDRLRKSMGYRVRER